MTHTIQTSEMQSLRRGWFKSFSFHVEVTNYDGETYDYDVEADSYEEASEKVEMLCIEDLIDIYHMNIYKF